LKTIRLIGLWAAPLIFIAVLFYWPLVNIISRGLEANWFVVYFEAATLRAIWFTIWQAALSTLIALVIGIPSAYVLYRKRFFGQRFIRALITVPLVLPTIVVAIVFSSFRAEHEIYTSLGLGFFFENSIYWIIAAHVFVNYSLVVRIIGGVWVNLDNETEEAASLAGAGRFKTTVAVTLPQLKTAVVSAGSLTFLFCSSSYGIILILGGGLVQSIETQIATAALQFLDLQKAAALALLQTAITAIAFLISESISRTPVGIEIVDETTQKPSVDWRDWPAIAITAFMAIGMIAIPLVLVLVKAFTFEGALSFQNFENLAGRGDRDLLNISVGAATLNTLRNVAISTVIAMALGVLISYLLSRSLRSRKSKAAHRVIDVLFLIPIGISSVVLSFGYLITFGSGPLPLRESWLVVPIVQSLMALPLVVRIVYPALVSIGTEHREAAAMAGASASETWWSIEAGIIRSVILTAAGFAMIAGIGEFGAASLLAYGDQATLPTVLYALISRPGEQNFGMAMAVCAILIAMTFILVLAVSARNPRRRSLVAQ
jgi:thiamine transport system permease protein